MKIKTLSFAQLSVLILALIFVGCSNPDQELTNGQLSIQLSANSDGVPFIKSISSVGNGQVMISDSTGGAIFQDRLTKGFVNDKVSLKQISGWETTEDSIFVKAYAVVGINQVQLSLHVDLMKDSPMIRVYSTAKTDSKTNINQFPVYGFTTSLADSATHLTWWEALDYTPQKECIANDISVVLGSRRHSAESENGVQGYVPYWTVNSPKYALGFSLAWSGGWRAKFEGNQTTLSSDVYLPERDVQLSLEPNEEVKGPELIVYCSNATNPLFFRNEWIANRKHLAQKLYPYPELKCPLIYNHWYAAHEDLSATFLKNQVKALDDYGFDVLMIDGGWYKDIGSWTPHTVKFPGDSFTSALEPLKSKGAMLGLWSCPQLMATGKEKPAYIDQPGYYSSGMKAWQVDYKAIGFTSFLNKHLDTLTNQLGAQWWKFDQNFFAKTTRAGKMKNVIALQDAFAAARRSYPNLIIEECMGGGKMLNEFTDQISQIHWIRDGARTGYMHAITNIHEALGSVSFLDPTKVQRWTNRINELEIGNNELLKLYCRSCMIGSWGISTDLEKIKPAQKSIIVSEIKNYRQLNEVKKFNLVEYSFPKEYTSLVPVVFYNDSLNRAGIIIYRILNDVWNNVNLTTRLMPDKTYSVYDVDANQTTIVKGNKLELKLKPDQHSAMFFVTEMDRK